MLATASVGGAPFAVDVFLIRTFPFRSLQSPAMFCLITHPPNQHTILIIVLFGCLCICVCVYLVKDGFKSVFFVIVSVMLINAANNSKLVECVGREASECEAKASYLLSVIVPKKILWVAGECSWSTNSYMVCMTNCTDEIKAYPSETCETDHWRMREKNMLSRVDARSFLRLCLGHHVLSSTV